MHFVTWLAIFRSTDLMVVKFVYIPLIPQFKLICRINKITIVLLLPIVKSDCIYIYRKCLMVLLMDNNMLNVIGLYHFQVSDLVFHLNFLLLFRICTVFKTFSPIPETKTKMKKQTNELITTISVSVPGLRKGQRFLNVNSLSSVLYKCRL